MNRNTANQIGEAADAFAKIIKQTTGADQVCVYYGVSKGKVNLTGHAGDMGYYSRIGFLNDVLCHEQEDHLNGKTS